MDTTRIVYLSPKDCKYTFSGTNLHEFRRAQLRRVAASLGIESAADISHNDLLKAIIHRLDTLNAPDEITELKSQEEQPAKKKARKKKKK